MTFDFNAEILNRGQLEQPEESQETIIGTPYQIETDNTLCTYTDVSAAAGHNEFFVTWPFSGMFPGQMYFLDSFDDGGIKPLIANLNPITFSINLQNINNSPFYSMSNPSTSDYRNGHQSVLENGVNGSTSAVIEFEKVEVHESDQLALEISTAFSGFGANVEGYFDFNNNQRKSFYLVKLTQVYYTIEPDLTATKPSDWFATLPEEEYLAQNEGSLVYVHSMKYGRRLILAVSSNYETSRVKKMLEASYNGIVAGGEINLTNEDAETFEETEIKAFVMGGGGIPAVNLISNIGNLESYLLDGANYSQESPGELIGFTLRYLSDNSIAKHVNTAEYTKRNCVTIEPTDEIYEIQAYGNRARQDYCPLETPESNGTSLGSSCIVDGDFELFVKNNKEIWARIKCHYDEVGDDTEALVNIEFHIHTLPFGKKFKSFITKHKEYINYVDSDQEPDTFNFNDSFIDNIEITAAAGSDAVPCNGYQNPSDDRAHLAIWFDKFEIYVENE